MTVQTFNFNHGYHLFIPHLIIVQYADLYFFEVKKKQQNNGTVICMHNKTLISVLYMYLDTNILHDNT